MDHFDKISVEDLQQALENVEGKKPTQRLLAAISYKNGISQTELAEWHDVQRKTIYSWLKRLEAQSIEQAVTDAHRSGRPRKLSSDQQNKLEKALHNPPTERGYDAPRWTPALVHQYLRETFDTEYSIPSCRRLMKEAGLRYTGSYRTAPHASSDNSDRLTKGDEIWKPK